MGNRKMFFSLLSAAAIGLLSTGCGGSSGTKTVDLTVSVPTTVTAKKGKHHKEISVAEVKGVLLEDGTEVEGTEDADGNFIVKVPEGSDVRILATIQNENGSEITFESFVNDATESDQVVDEDTTRVATLILSEGESNAISVKELLAQEQDVIAEMNALLESFNNRDYLNEVIDSAGSEESIEDLKERLENAIEKLKRISRLLAAFDERLAQFENSTEPVKFDELTEDDVKDDEDEDESEDDDFVKEFIVREPGVQSIAIGEEFEGRDVEVYINDDGSISIERGDEMTTTDPVLSRGGVSGRFVSGSEEGFTISVKKDGTVLNVDFTFAAEAADLMALVKTFTEGDEIVVTYTAVEGNNVAKAIYAEGFLTGTLTALTKTSVTITLVDGTSVELPIKTEDEKVIIPLPLETAKKYMLVADEPGIEPVEEVTEDVMEITSEEEFDVSVLSELEDNNTFEINISDVKVGDQVILHWQIENNVKVVSGIFLDEPISIDDPILDETRPTILQRPHLQK